MLEIIESYTAETDAQRDTVVASAGQNICNNRGQGPGTIDSGCEDRPIQTLLGGGTCLLVSQGDHIAAAFLLDYILFTNVRIQAFLFKAPQADFSMQNVGGCRRGISGGDVTAENVIAVLPFSNTLVTINMKGSLIKETLEDALNNFLRDDDLKGSTGSFPASAGLRWELDYTAEFGNRVSNIEMNRRLKEDEWTPLDMSSNYTVAVNCECTTTCWQDNICGLILTELKHLGI